MRICDGPNWRLYGIRRRLVYWCGNGGVDEWSGLGLKCVIIEVYVYKLIVSVKISLLC